MQAMTSLVELQPTADTTEFQFFSWTAAELTGKLKAFPEGAIIPLTIGSFL
jgi:hypothetical protein